MVWVICVAVMPPAIAASTVCTASSPPFGPRDGGAEDLVGIGIHHHPHRALRLALLHGPRHARHGPHADAHLVAGLPRLGFGHADAAQRRVGEQCADRNPVPHRALGAIEQIGRHHFEIVVGGAGVTSSPGGKASIRAVIEDPPAAAPNRATWRRSATSPIGGSAEVGRRSLP